MRYYIADNHFYHKNLITRMDNRNFKTIEEMNEKMIEIHNSIVRTNDEVVFIGDLSFGNGKETMEIIKRLNGTKYLIEGNHDHKYLQDKDFDKSVFKWIAPYKELSDNKRKVVLCHYPILFYNGQYRKNESGDASVYHLCGHVHDTGDNKMLNDFILQQRNKIVESKGQKSNMNSEIINCFCMFSDYKPLTLDEWISVNEKRLADYKEIKNGKN